MADLSCVEASNSGVLEMELSQIKILIKIACMRLLIVLATVFALNSCNTTIGMYRDTKQAFSWTKNKIQGSSGGGGGGEEYGAPVY